MRAFLVLVSGMVLLLSATTGCGPDLSADDLGETVFEVPTVAEADGPYELPECKASPPKEGMFAAP